MRYVKEKKDRKDRRDMKDRRELGDGYGAACAAVCLTVAAATAIAPTVAGAAACKRRGPVTDDDFVNVQGSALVTAGGNSVDINGVNLNDFNFGCRKDNKIYVGEDREIFELLAARFGNYGAREIFGKCLDSQLTPADIKKLKKLKINCIRIPLRSYLLFKDENIKKEEPQLKRLDKIIKNCGRAGIYVVLSLKSAPGYESDAAAFEDSKKGLAKRDDIIKIWSKLSRHYADNAVIAAYDLLDSPTADITENAQYTQAYNRLCLRAAGAIRSLGDNHPIIIENAGSFPDFSAMKELKTIAGFSVGEYTEYEENSLTDFIDKIRDAGIPQLALTVNPHEEEADNLKIGLFRRTLNGCDPDSCIYSRAREMIDLDNDSYDEICQKLSEK